MRLPHRRAPRTADSTSRALRGAIFGAISRPSRRARLVAAGGVLALAAGVGSFVVLGEEEPEQAAPIQVTGSTFIELPDRASETVVRTRKARRPGRSEAGGTAPVPLGDPGSRRLIIPALGVDSVIVSITAPGGTLTPPGDAQEVGWWSDGAAPGAEVGSALMTGHTLSSGGAALQDLEDLEPGDRMSVQSAGAVLDYRVSDVEIFSKGTVAADAAELFSQSAPGRLVVITCEDYDGSVYLSNVVVTATPIGTSAFDF